MRLNLIINSSKITLINIREIKIIIRIIDNSSDLDLILINNITKTKYKISSNIKVISKHPIINRTGSMIPIDKIDNIIKEGIIYNIITNKDKISIIDHKTKDRIIKEIINSSRNSIIIGN